MHILGLGGTCLEAADVRSHMCAPLCVLSPARVCFLICVDLTEVLLCVLSCARMCVAAHTCFYVCHMCSDLCV